jgi:hypothetical protein
MATTKQQLDIELKRLRDAESLLKSAQYQKKIQGDKVTAATKKALLEAPKKIEQSKKRIAALEKQIAKVPETKLSPKQLKTVAKQEIQKELPAGIYDEKIINDLAALGLTPEAFKVGGVGAGILVYMGEKKGKTTTPVGGFVTPTKVADVALTNNVIQSFWTDSAIQKKVTSALIAAGNSNATQLDAFATWQTVVSQSAQLYAAGKGPKFTPFDVLDMVMTKAKGKPDVTTYLDVPRQAELKEKLKGRIFEYIQKEPDDNDPIFQNILNDIKGTYEKGITTTTTVDPKTGRKIVQQKGGVTDALIASKIKKAYDENNVDFLENKSLEAADYFSQWMRS